jgi:hypothetical protein
MEGWWRRLEWRGLEEAGRGRRGRRKKGERGRHKGAGEKEKEKMRGVDRVTGGRWQEERTTV